MHHRWPFILVALALLLACGQKPHPPAPADPGPAALSAVALPDDYRRCVQAADCVVAPALAGLDRLPRPDDTCEGTCFVGVRASAALAWHQAVKALAATVPCDKQFEECPPVDHFRVTCIFGRCGAKYVGTAPGS
jgi:hypothetical protein